MTVAPTDMPIGSVWERIWGGNYHVYKITGHSFNGPVLIVETERMDPGRRGHRDCMAAGWLASRSKRLR